MDKVAFFLLGAAKAGTSALADELGRNTDISFASIKEPRFFAPSIAGRRGPGSEEFNRTMVHAEEDYRSLFPDTGVKGEASVDYLWSEEAPKLIHDYNPEARLIIVLRCPIQRMRSEYVHLLRDGYISHQESLSASLVNEERRYDNKFIPLFFHKRRSLYYESVKRYFEMFGRNKILIIEYEAYKRFRNETLSRISEFLDVSPNFSSEPLKVNVGFLPRSYVLAKLINSYYLKEFIKIVIPLRVGKILKRKLNSLNKKAISSNDPRFIVPPDVELELVSDFNKTLNYIKDQGGLVVTAECISDQESESSND